MAMLWSNENGRRGDPFARRWHSTCTCFRTMNLRRLTIYGICAGFCASRLAAAVEWQISKVDGRDFLSVDNIAKFYGFSDPVVDGPNIKLGGDKNELQFRVGSRELLLNGVRNWLSFPVFVHDEKVLVSRIDLAKTIEPQLRPNMIKNLGRVQTIVLDPGHGGFDKARLADTVTKR